MPNWADVNLFGKVFLAGNSDRIRTAALAMTKDFDIFFHLVAHAADQRAAGGGAPRQFMLGNQRDDIINFSASFADRFGNCLHMQGVDFGNQYGIYFDREPSVSHFLNAG